MSNQSTSRSPDGRVQLHGHINEVHARLQEKRRTDRSGLHVNAVTLSADDSVLLTFCYGRDRMFTRLAFFVSDASCYPSNHSFICTNPDHPPAWLSRVLQAVTVSRSMSIKQLLSVLLSGMTDAVGTHPNETVLNTLPSGSSTATSATNPLARKVLDVFDGDALQRDFQEMIMAGCRPGYLASRHHLSVSLPTITFLNGLQSSSLLACDKKFFSPNKHIALLIDNIGGTYPPLELDGSYRQNEPPYFRFRVGLVARHKPRRCSSTHVHSKSVDKDVAENELELQPFDMTSTTMEDLMNGDFLDILRLRIRHKLHWAGAELLHVKLGSSSTSTQLPVSSVLESLRPYILRAEYEEGYLLAPYKRLMDPSSLTKLPNQQHLNLQSMAFSYILRRLVLGDHFCMVCHKPAKKEFEQQQPFTCDLALCKHQLYHGLRGQFLEYEICSKPEAVDLLLSLTYVAANEMVLDPLPTGLGLHVAIMDPCFGVYRMQALDTLTMPQICIAIRDLIASLPPISQMKAYLEGLPAHHMAVRLQDMDRTVPAAAWVVLRWCVASCTAQIDAVLNPDERVHGIGSEWRQFRVTIASPAAECRFQQAVQRAQKLDNNAIVYPTLYAFHGSPLENWHSILRYGLRYKTIRLGRRYGDGIYLAKDAAIAMRFANFAPSASQWLNRAWDIKQCMTLVQIVNQPAQFVYGHQALDGKASQISRNSFVVGATDWVICRYLFIKSKPLQGNLTCLSVPSDSHLNPSFKSSTATFIPMDPRHPLTMGETIKIAIPNYVQKLSDAVKAWWVEHTEEANDEINTSNGFLNSQCF